MLSDVHRRRFGGISGMIGPVLFVAVFTVEGWLRPDYRPLAMYISELSLGPRGWIQQLNFVVIGVLFLFFANGVAAEFRTGKASKAGPAILGVIGVALFLSGPLVTDPGGIQTTRHGVLHGLFGAAVFSLSPLSCFVFFRRFREDRHWRPLARPTLFLGIVVLISVVLMKIGQLESSRLHPMEGFIQRMALITFLGWIFSFARHLSAPRSLSPVFSGPSRS